MAKKIEKAIAFLLYTTPGGLTAQELQAKEWRGRPIPLAPLEQMKADGIVEVIDGRYFLTDIGQRAYID